MLVNRPIVQHPGKHHTTYQNPKFILVPGNERLTNELNERELNEKKAKLFKGLTMNELNECQLE